VTIDSGQPDLPGVIRGHVPDGLQGAVECSGHPSAFAAAVRALAPGATVVVVGAPPTGTITELDIFDLTLGSKRIVGSCEGNSVPAEMIPHLATLVRSGELPIERLIERYPFDEIERAARDMSTGRVIKPVLTFA
jgi:aryl-alcohol dehydrogenase